MRSICSATERLVHQLPARAEAVFGAGSYLLLAQRYWFHMPFIGIALATACILGAAVMPTG